MYHITFKTKYLESTPHQRTDIYMEEQALWEIWQEFGVVGTPATDSAGSIRVYAHSRETRSSAPTAVILGREGEGTMQER